MNVAAMNLSRHVQRLPLLEVHRHHSRAVRHAARLETVAQAEETAAILRATRYERAARLAELAGARTALLRREVCTLLELATDAQRVDLVAAHLALAEEFLDASDRYVVLGRDRSAGRLRLEVQDLLDAIPSLIAA